jgi:hypothetical protein
MGITKNAVSDYGLDNTGVVDIIPTVSGTMRTEATGQDFATITYPAGTYLVDSFGGNGGNYVPDCGDYTLEGAGATFTGDETAGYVPSSKHITQIGIDHASGQSARIQTARPGDTSVTLTAASASAGHISRFSVGQYIMVCSWSLQADFVFAYSFPPNYHWTEYRKITSIVDNTIHFAEALVDYHDENWPELNRGSSQEADAAGPATILAVSLDWDGTTTINDATFDYPASGSATFLNGYRHTMIANNVTCTGKTMYPSVCHTYRAIDCSSANVLVEADKNVELVDIQGGTYRTWKAQSSSTRLMRVDGATITNILQGTARNTVINNSSIAGACQIGAIAYGKCETYYSDNTVYSGAITSGAPIITGTRFQGQGIQDCVFMASDGVMTIPMSTGSELLSFMMPDSHGRNVLYWSAGSGNIGAFKAFKILSVTSDRWPAADNATADIGISIPAGSRTLTTDSPLFTSGDVGKVLFVPGMRLGSSNSGYADCTISNASPGVVTYAGHGKRNNDPIKFIASGGTLPSQITAGTIYYVVNAATNTFQIASTAGGAAINTSGGSGTVRVSYLSDIYTFITGYIDSTNVTLFDHNSADYDLVSVSRALQYGTCNAYVQTDQTELPSSSLYGTKLNIYVPAVRAVRFTNCTGHADAVDLSQAGAYNKPLFSYTKRSYTGTLPNTDTTQVKVFGAPVSIKVNVTRAYTGASTLNMSYAHRCVTSGALAFNTVLVNLKILGERVLTPAGNTGAQSLDTLPSQASVEFLGSGFGIVKLSRDISGESSADWPEFTLEVITDQGLSTAPVAVVPLRFRLRAA